jgi:hypothetical protein
VGYARSMETPPDQQEPLPDKDAAEADESEFDEETKPLKEPDESEQGDPGDETPAA